LPPDQEPDVDTERIDLEERLRQIREELDRQGRGGSATDAVQPPVAPDGTGEQFGPSLIDVLRDLSANMNVRIGVDATVKPIPVSLNFDPVTVPVTTALTRILDPIGYAYKFNEEDGTYLVFKPISNSFQGDELRQALQDISADAGVTIVPDPNVTGDVYAELDNVPLETALKTILAGSPFVVHVTPDYYLVADRSPDGPGFFEYNVTRNVFLNYTSPQRALQLLAGPYAPYVRADTDPNSHIVSITADRELADQIVRVVKELDARPRHVLLDARVVVMERSDLLDVGVEWDFGQLSAGFFDNDISARGWGVQLGYTSDRTFTDSLLLALNLLEKNGQAEISSNTQVLAQDGKLSDFNVIKEEYYMLVPPIANTGLFYTQTEMVTIESGTKLSITPRIGDNNDITLYMAAEVSNSIPSAAATELPVVTRRTARNVVTVMNGGTAALAGLTESREEKTDQKVPLLGDLPVVGGLFKNKENDQSTREIAIFVTATLVDDLGRDPLAARAPQSAVSRGLRLQPQPVNQGFAAQPQPFNQGYAAQPQPRPRTYRDDLRDALAR
jgi:type II secretory pathway component GspD/PulD (secretin)